MESVPNATDLRNSTAAAIAGDAGVTYTARICPKCGRPAPYEKGVMRRGSEDYHFECAPVVPKPYLNEEWLYLNKHIGV